MITKQYTHAPEGKTLLVPSYSKWSDDRLMEGDDQDFMKKLYHRAKDLGDDCYDAMAYELTPLDPEIYRQNLIYYMRRRAWSEWFFGTVSPPGRSPCCRTTRRRSSLGWPARFTMKCATMTFSKNTCDGTAPK